MTKLNYDALNELTLKYYNEIQVLKRALELACNDAADGCCPFEITDDYENDECKTCSNHLGEREDSQKDMDCWKKYYLSKANLRL